MAPDGICLDAEGHLWVANALAAECVRVAEGGGDLARVVTSHQLLRLHAGRRRPHHAVPRHRWPCGHQGPAGSKRRRWKSAHLGPRRRTALTRRGRRRRVGGGGTGPLTRRHTRQWIPARALAWAAAGAAAAGVLIGVWSAPPAGAAPAPPYLVALGGSASVGVQPTAAHPRGEPTTWGYAEDLVPLERLRWPGLTVVHLGCPGATTVSMLDGGGHCPYAGRVAARGRPRRSSGTIPPPCSSPSTSDSTTCWPACGTRSSTPPVWTERSRPAPRPARADPPGAAQCRRGRERPSWGSATTTPILGDFVRGPMPDRPSRPPASVR